MKRLFLLRLLVIAGFIGFVEALCRIGIIDNFTMPPPSRIAADLARALASGKFNGAIRATLSNAALAFCMAVTVGIAAAVVIHRLAALRTSLDPFFATYYAVPVLAFYPLLIILFGLGSAPKVIIAFMLGVVAVIVNTLNGLDRVPKVLLKSARMARMGWFATATQITLPSAAPFVLTGVKFAVAYALIGIIGSEFIMSTDGIGFEIAFAYNNFDNATMYPLIVLVMIISIFVNTLLSIWEKQLLQRRGLR
jgi:NitT/TauT family transport system permease protein